MTDLLINADLVVNADLVIHLAPTYTDLDLPRWNEKHSCQDFAELVHTWRQLTRYGSAVWLVQQCRVCGEPWDVLSDRSDERVIIASVYPVWAIKGCELCTAECLGEPCRCPCHQQLIGEPEVPGQGSLPIPTARVAIARTCCDLHDRDPDLMGPCAPDEQGGYCCNDCPTLAKDGAGRD